MGFLFLMHPPEDLTWADSWASRNITGNYQQASLPSFALARVLALAMGHMDPIELMVRQGRSAELEAMGIVVPNWVWRNLQQGLTKS